MAFKNDWTPGILPYIVAPIMILILSLGASSLFDNQTTSISAFIITAVALSSLLLMIVRRNKRMNSRSKK
jgi:positive regulator of sigma E activity